MPNTTTAAQCTSRTKALVSYLSTEGEAPATNHTERDGNNMP